MYNNDVQDIQNLWLRHLQYVSALLYFCLRIGTLRGVIDHHGDYNMDVVVLLLKERLMEHRVLFDNVKVVPRSPALDHHCNFD